MTDTDVKEESYSDLEVAHAEKEERFPILEIFGPTLQGEGAMCGMQTMFIRLGGCDYRCKMCDSLHAVDPVQIKALAKRMTVEEIVSDLIEKAGHCNVVTLSGGNPAMWDISELVELLHYRGFKIAVETQGTIWRDWIAECDWVTVSPKGPGMGETFEQDKFMAFGANLNRKRIHGNFPSKDNGISIKVVLFDQQDIEFAKQIKELVGGTPFYLSVGNPFPPNNPNAQQNAQVSEGGRSEMILALLNRMSILYEDVKNEPTLANARFYPQMHVLLWGNEQGR